MSLRSRAAAVLLYLLPILTGMVVAPFSHAGAFGISPLRLDLGPKARTASLSVQNLGQVPLRFQVEALRWRQDEAGTPINEPTSDLVYFPRLLTVPPGQEGVIRVGLRQPLVAAEQTFVIFVQEQPVVTGEDAGGTEGAGVNVRLRMGATVFVQPVREVSQLEWLGGELRAGQVSFALRNAGNRHQAFEQVSIIGLDSTGTTLFRQELKPGRYVLANHVRRFTAPVSQPDCARVARLEVRITTDQTRMQHRIEAEAPSCP